MINIIWEYGKWLSLMKHTIQIILYGKPDNMPRMVRDLIANQIYVGSIPSVVSMEGIRLDEDAVLKTVGCKSFGGFESLTFRKSSDPIIGGHIMIKYSREEHALLFDVFFKFIYENFILVVVPDSKIRMIREVFFPAWLEKKLGEKRFKYDRDKMFQRCLTGFLGEAAVEVLFGINFIDWSVGVTDAYNYADLKALGINAGIKTCRVGNFPLIKRNTKRPQLICIRISDNEVLVGGFASLDKLHRFTDDKLILDDKAKEWKTAFWGIHDLKYFTNLEELRLLV